MDPTLAASVKEAVTIRYDPRSKSSSSRQTYVELVILVEAERLNTAALEFFVTSSTATTSASS